VASSSVLNVLLAAREAWILLETSESPYSSYLNGRASGKVESSIKVRALNNKRRQLQGDEVSERLYSVCYCDCVCEQWLGTAGK
jgi:hypothetical protein